MLSDWAIIASDCPIHWAIDWAIAALHWAIDCPIDWILCASHWAMPFPYFVLFQKDFFIIMQSIAQSSWLIAQFIVQLIAQFVVAIGQSIVQ